MRPIRKALARIIRFSETDPGYFTALLFVLLILVFTVVGAATTLVPSEWRIWFVPGALFLLEIPLLTLVPLAAKSHFSLDGKTDSRVDWWVNGLKAFAEGY